MTEENDLQSWYLNTERKHVVSSTVADSIPVPKHRPQHTQHNQNSTVWIILVANYYH